MPEQIDRRLAGRICGRADKPVITEPARGQFFNRAGGTCANGEAQRFDVRARSRYSTTARRDKQKRDGGELTGGVLCGVRKGLEIGEVVFHAGLAD